MYIVTIQFPNSDGATFDFNHFHREHLPEVGKAFLPFGLGWASVLHGQQSLDGSEPAFFALILLSFPTEQAARNAFASEAAAALMSEVPNFTSVTPQVQFNLSVK